MPRPLIKEWLAHGSGIFKACSATPMLDARLLLGHVLSISQAQLLALPLDATLTDGQLETLTALSAQRIAGYPVAYLVGYQEFYGHRFIVGPGVLIPRADSEIIIDTLIALHQKKPITSLRDIGTGPGTLAITLFLALRCPVMASDISPVAASFFKQNNLQLAEGGVSFMEGSLLDDGQSYDVIVANLPYLTTDETADRLVNEHWQEPALALDGGLLGLNLIATLINQSRGKCRLLLLEADPTQMESIEALMRQEGYTDVETFCDLRADERIIIGYNHNYKEPKQP